MRIAVFGCGYVGLVTGACFAKLGHDVVAYDIDHERLALLAAGRCPIVEPDVPELIVDMQRSGRLRFVDNPIAALQSRDLAFICVGTPPRGPRDGRSDLSSVAATAEVIASHAAGDLVVVGKSTVPAGTGQEIRRILERRKQRDVRFHLGSNPETLKEGSAVRDFLHPDRVIIGADDEVARDRLLKLYATFDCPKVVTDVTSAELVKLVANFMLAQRISTANLSARLCEAVGADVEVVMHGVGLDRRIGADFLRAGVGFGGSCFPKDVRSLGTILDREGIPSDLVSSVLEVNERQVEWFLRRIERALFTLRGRRIALLGLAFKPNTDDVRESRALAIAARLLDEGAIVVAYDPAAASNAQRCLPAIEIAPTTLDACRGAAAIILATEWEEFRQVDWAAIFAVTDQPVIFDGRNALDGRALRALGFEYHGIGRPHATDVDGLIHRTPSSTVARASAFMQP